MLVREIMSHKMETILPKASLRDAAQIMRDLKIGSLAVAEDGRLVGMITDRDICCRGVAEGFDADNTAVSEIMSRDVGFCFTSDSVSDAVRLMEHRHIRRLPVLNSDKSVAGLLSVDDVAHYSRQLAGEVLDTLGHSKH